VGNGAAHCLSAWAKSLGAVAHADMPVRRFCPPYEAPDAMTTTIQILLLLLAVLVVVAVVARRLDVAPSILLVVAGVALALIPGLPSLELAPEVVLLVLLPPLLYSAGVSMSWREFRFNLRPITLLAVGCVVFTTCAVAGAAHWLLGLPWAVGFLLGAIVASWSCSKAKAW
jgi:NhaP-type Na+/H+ or K+/H+ antiporter